MESFVAFWLVFLFCLKEVGVNVVQRSEQASIVENLGDVERRKYKDLITDALKLSKWGPLIRYGAYQPTFEALIVIN